MPVYKYSALNEQNEIINDQIDAGSIEEVRRVLSSEGQKLVKIKRDMFAKSSSGKKILKRIAATEIAAFCKQLSIISKSGISVLKGLVMVQDQTDNVKVRQLAHNLSMSIQKGCSLSDAFANCGFRLPLLLVNMVKVGEVSGNLDDIFKKMAAYYENETRIRKKITSALVYPCILLCVSIGVITLFTFFILPELVGIIQDTGGELPLITKIMMGTSKFVAVNIVYIAIAVAILALLYVKAVPQKVKTNFKEFMLFKVPVVARVSVDFITSRVIGTMGMLITSGLSVLTIMDTLEKVVGNEKISRGIADAKEKINTGESLSASFAQMGFFDNMVINIISISEETGNLGESLLDLADYYQERFESGISKAVAMLEPMFTLGMGAVIAVILLSAMLPMFNMIGSLSNQN